jgi:predicted Rossmann fold flavoprotein
VSNWDVVVLGAGAAGMMCAATAAARGRQVLLVDHAAEPGRKILISGGGRCNFTNLETVADRFLSQNRHFARSALARYKPADFLALVARHGIAWHEKTLGQLFCDGSARQIVAMLVAECQAAGVVMRLGTKVGEVSRADRFRVELDGASVFAESLVIATGGLSIPKIGATGLAYDLARRFELPLTDIQPGLVPLTFGGDDLAWMRPLAGVALPVLARCGGARFAEAMLFTHRGLSGPALLQASSYWRAGETLVLDLLPGQNAEAILLERKRGRPRAELRSMLGEMLPVRLAAALAQSGAEGATTTMANLPDRVLAALGQRLNRFELEPDGTEGYAKAEVTLGGIDTAGLSQKTMQAVTVPGLYAIGEAVDVTGWLGGYNFQWAWASGWCAGQAA